MEQLWRDLASTHAAKAYRAICAFRRMPREAVPFLAGHLPVAVRPDPRQVEGWINELNNEHFAVRERAGGELEKLGGLAEPALRRPSG
jgi:hypothetical protein